MAAIQPPIIFDEVVDFLTSAPSSEDIIAYQLPQQLVERFNDLAQRNKRDQLSKAEFRELEEFLRMNHLITRMKNRARGKLINK